NGIETLKVAEIFNITRILFLPIIVLWLAVWYVKREQTGERINLGQVIFAKFPLFVIGFILMFLLGSTGVFAPAQHYKGKFFDNSEKVMVKTDKDGKVHDKRLSDANAEKLKAEMDKLQREDHKAALTRLIQEKKVMAPDHDITIRGIINGKIMSKEATDILKKQHEAVYHTAKKIKMFRNLIAWFFAFGLTGLGMQITMASIKQAGGQPLVIGSVVGTVKALGSLVVVLLFVSEIV
ncbi:MAG TPA: putative sulfate exporter family transporter, partial [Burkholderiales bacterium]|nr:putative sulfate exporter family transporter [Burkholderiales bacterium]